MDIKETTSHLENHLRLIRECIEKDISDADVDDEAEDSSETLDFGHSTNSSSIQPLPKNLNNF